MSRRKKDWKEHIPVIKKQSKKLGKEIATAAKEITRLSKHGYKKARPHVKAATKKAGAYTKQTAKRIGPAVKSARKRLAPAVTSAYNTTKLKVQKTYSKLKSHKGTKKENHVLHFMSNKKYIIALGMFIFIAGIILMGDGTPKGAVQYKFPDEREFSYPDPSPVECPAGMSGECSQGFYTPAAQGCPISCDDDDPCTQDTCNGQGCENKPIEGCT
ncbi:MAG: hypothetical protein ACQESG_06860 [Nanobdellota archaeon]